MPRFNKYQIITMVVAIGTHLEARICDLITQARISELEKLALDVGAFPDDIANYGGELLGKWSERKLTHSKIEDRIKELSE